MKFVCEEMVIGLLSGQGYWSKDAKVGRITHADFSETRIVYSRSGRMSGVDWHITDDMVNATDWKRADYYDPRDKSWITEEEERENMITLFGPDICNRVMGPEKAKQQVTTEGEGALCELCKYYKGVDKCEKMGSTISKKFEKYIECNLISIDYDKLRR